MAPKLDNLVMVKNRPHLEHEVKALEATLAKLANKREERDKPWKMI